MNPIDAYLVYGFLDAGKTTYIQDCILHDFFHKRGTTLILCLEAGETEYDAAALAVHRTRVEVYQGGEELTAFCREALMRHRPDRVYLEMNAMRTLPRERLPEELRVVFSTALIDGRTLDVYMRNLRQQLQDMVSQCDMVTFNRCAKREKLAPYAQIFRLMNRRATYLWQAPAGYHEKAFDLFVPFELDQPEITIREEDFIPFILDAAAHPEHYDGKQLRLQAQVLFDEREDPPLWKAGRTVMTCCMADLQFMSLPCVGISREALPRQSWVSMTARGQVRTDRYGRRKLWLSVLRAEAIPPPVNLILSGTTGGN